jgi:hypothetical protein
MRIRFFAQQVRIDGKSALDNGSSVRAASESLCAAERSGTVPRGWVRAPGNAGVVGLSWLALALLVQLSAALSPVRVAASVQVPPWIGIAVAFLAGLALARLGAAWPARVSLALSRIWAAMLLVELGSAYVTPWTGALADPWLSWPDGGEGGLAAAGWLQAHGLWGAAVLGYGSGYQALLLVLLVADRPHRIGDAFALCGVVGILAYVAAPAEGPRLGTAFLGCAAGGQPEWGLLRSGAPVVLERLPGLISIPSFHALSATILLQAVWSRRWLRPLALAWGALLVGSAWTVGGHYGLDLVAGVGLAVGAWGIVS